MKKKNLKMKFSNDKFKNSSNSLKKIISVQETLGDKTGLGFNLTNVSTSENKNEKFECESSKQKPLDSKPKYILIKDKKKIPIASAEEVKSFYKPSLKAKTGFSKLKLRSKTPPPNRPNNPHPRSKTPQHRRNQGRQNFSNNIHPMWNYQHQPSFNPWGILPPYMHPSQLQTMFGSNNFGQMRPWESSG
jgi:hypothetical protein